MRRCLIAGIGVVFLAAVLAAPAAEQKAAGFKKGDCALLLIGDGVSDVDMDPTTAAISAEMNHFFADTLAVAVRQGIAYDNATKNRILVKASTRVAADYYLPVNKAYPFVGLGLGYRYGQNEIERFVAGPEVGVRAFVGQDAFVNASLQYAAFFRDLGGLADGMGAGRFEYGLGLGVRF
jgi:hypothetical protein